jgi:nucleoside-diphosphate-sugar epimerase
MRILVTGGTGNVGRALVARLVRHGHQVRVMGRRAGASIEGAEYSQCDMTDFGGVRERVRGCQAVAHLAAIAGPGGGPNEEVFRVNCAGAFNVYQAAAQEGIRRVATASSINALGYFYGVKGFELSYLPVDEEHPTFTTDPYSFSKQITEEIAAYFWRRDGISGVCLRLPAVHEGTEERLKRLAQGRPRMKELVAEYLALPQAERETRVRRMGQKYEQWRAGRPMEAASRGQRRKDGGWNDPDIRLMVSKVNFWADMDAEDSAQAFEKALLADYEGSHPLFVNDSHNSAGVEAEDLARVFYPEVRARKRPLRGTEALVSIERARRLIGFEPEWSAASG